jgi:hypothetical protein
VARSTRFVVIGPFDVTVRKAKTGAREIDKLKSVASIDKASAGAAKKPGCYVFSCRTGGGSLPWYVGMAAGSVLKQAFNPRNELNLNKFLNARERGALQLFVVHQQRRWGLFGNKRAIAEMEGFLIAEAAIRNPDILNRQGVGGEPWSIEGVTQRSPGGIPAPAREFATLMGINA